MNYMKKLKKKQGLKTLEMAVKFIKNYDEIKGYEQVGESSFF